MASEKNLGLNTKKSMVVCVGGMAGSGKSTLARKLAEKYGLRYLSGGDALKALASKYGFKPHETGWWETNEGLNFLEERSKDSRFDEAVDKRLLQEAQAGNVVLDSWTMPWLFKGGFKIWLEASLEKRAQRIANRDKISVEEARKALMNKERETKSIYKKLYGFSLGEDLTPFNFILDTDNLEIEEVFRILCMVMDNVFLSQHSLVEKAE
jgi:cytidylate kinase